MLHPRLAILGLLALAPLQGGFECTPGGAPIVIHTPAAGALVDDSFVQVSAEVPAVLDESGAVMRLDGVDLIAALGLVPPFTNASGTVVVGGTPIGVSSFTWALGTGSPDQVTLSIAGLGTGLHLLEVGAKNGTVLTSVASGFEQVPPFALALETTSAGGLPAGPATFGAGQRLWNASAGGALASPPVPLSDGGAVRGGFVFAAESRSQP